MSQFGKAVIRSHRLIDANAPEIDVRDTVNPFRVKWLIATRKQPKKRMEFCVSLITKKIEASIQTLEKTARRSNAWGKSDASSLCLADTA